jgi:hypothetical protein
MKKLLLGLLGLLLSSAAQAQTDSYLALNGTFKNPFNLANTWTAAQTFNAAVTFAGTVTQTLAQFQILQGNGSNQSAPVTFSAAIDAAIGSTRGSVLERGASSWGIVTPGTSGFPWVSNGSGADPAYQALTAAGIANSTITNTQLAAGVAVANLGYTPVQQGTGVGQLSNAVKIGWNNTVLKATVDVTDEGSIFTTLTVPTISGGGTVNFLRADDTWAPAAQLNVQDQTLSGGANVTALSLATGSVTIDCGARPLQFITNGGAFTITAPANDGSCLLLSTNNASAGAITFSGFSVGSNTGDALTTTNTSKFTINIWRINGVSGYRVAAHQ